MDLKTRSAVALAACAVLVASLAACSSGGSDDKSAGGSTLPAVSGAGADSSKSPVLIGFETALQGAYALPDVQKGFNAGVEYVNAQLGGVNGSPLKATTCGTDGSPDSAVNCGNKFVQEKVALATLGFDYGADGILPVLKNAGIALFGYQAVTPGMNSSVGQAYFGSPSVEESFSSGVVVQHDRGVKSLAEIMPDLPSMREYFSKIVQPAAAKLNMTVKGFFYPTTPDWASFAATVVSTHPGGMTVYAADADSLAAIPAIRGAGFTGTIDASTSTSIINQLSSSILKNVLFVTPFFNNLYEGSALTPKVKGDIAAFEKYTKPTSSTIVNFAQFGFYTAVQAADMLRQISVKTGQPLTADSVFSNMKSTKGSEFFRNSTYNCSVSTWPGTTACSTGFNYADVTADKKLQPLPNSPINVSAVKPAT